MAANRDPLAGQRLDSWKEIASFFGRAERTVKRWEAERGLPVHRVPGSGRAAVFAYSDELAEWLKGRSSELEGEPAAETIEPAPAVGKVAEADPARASSFWKRSGAWLVPIALLMALALLSSGHRSLNFKAVAARHTPNADAQELYLKGRYYWERRTPDDLNRAVDYFMQAIVKDPSDAQAYVGLADCYNLLREFGAMPPSEAFPRALAAAQRAVELDDGSAEAHNSLAFATFWWSWQGATAEREFKRALELNPSFVRAHHWYGTYLMQRFRYPEAFDQLEQAQRLEPSARAILADKGITLWYAGRHNEGLTLLQQLETSEPSFSSTHDYLGRIFWEQKDYPGALREWRQTAELRHDQVGLAIADAREHGYATGGLNGLWQAELPVQRKLFEQGSGSAYRLAQLCAELGKREEALGYLQSAFDRHESGLLDDNDRNLVSLRDEPAYRDIRMKVEARLTQ